MASGADFLIEGNDSATGAAEVSELGGTGGAEIYKETDVDGDGSYEVSVMVDSFTGEWFSQQNGFIISAGERHRLRIRNTSGGTASYYATGMEVDD